MNQSRPGSLQYIPTTFEPARETSERRVVEAVSRSASRPASRGRRTEDESFKARSRDSGIEAFRRSASRPTPRGRRAKKGPTAAEKEAKAAEKAAKKAVKAQREEEYRLRRIQTRKKQRHEMTKEEKVVYDRNQRLKRGVSKPKEIFRAYNPQQVLHDQEKRKVTREQQKDRTRDPTHDQPSDDDDTSEDEDEDPRPKRTRRHSPRSPR
jgi:hypothetical protein